MIKTLPAHFFYALSFFSALSLFGCKDDVGVPCQMGSGTDTTGTSSTEIKGAQFDTPSTECESRICILTPKDTYPRCTKICDGDDDCPGSTENCSTGFHCVVATTTGPLKFCKVCVCKGVNIGTEGATPPSDVIPNCPKI